MPMKKLLKNLIGAKKPIICSLIAIVIVVNIINVLLTYEMKMSDVAVADAQAELAVHGDRAVAAFMADIQGVKQAAYTLAAILGEKPEVLTLDNIDLLRICVTSSSAYDGYIANAKGEAVDINNKKLNVWGNAEYGQVLAGKDILSDIELVAESDKDRISVYAPVLRDTRVVGAVCLRYDINRVRSFLSINAQEFNSMSGIARADGAMFGMTGENHPKAGAGLFDILDDYNVEEKGMIVKRVRQDFENNKSGQIVALVSGEPCYVGYRSVGTNGWFLFEVYSLDYYRTLCEEKFDVTRYMVVNIISCIILLLVFVLCITIVDNIIIKFRNKKLKELSETDNLTGLLNKVASESHLTEYLEGEGKYGRGILCVLDMDDFKHINNIKGHAYGDSLLAAFGRDLKRNFRPDDIVGRTSGDEFLLYLKDMKDDEAIAHEMSILKDYLTGYTRGEYARDPVTASVGVAIYPDDARNFATLYKAADAGVYVSKQKGKNKITYYRDIVK